MARRAALVIGVDKTGGGMPPLQSAAAGALEVAAWLRDEGYDVVELTDAAGPLHASRVKEELKTLVTYPATLDQLVVYFSGHGIRTAKVDRWLFSDAPGDTSDAINLHGAMTAAQYSGIPTVVFVSDACRSVPDGMFGEVTGIDAFPNLPVDTPSKVDVVRGAGRNQEAYEAVIPAEYGGDDSVRSVLTYALRSAYLNPPPEMTREIIVDGIEVTVVPNRRLEGYLQPRVDEILTGINVNLIQNLEINIPSPDEVFIARAAVGPDGPSGPYRSGGLERSPRRTIMDFGADRYTSVIDRLPENEQEVSKRNPRHDLLDHLESKCGFTVTGAEVDRVACTSGENGAWAEILPTSEPGSSIVRVWDVAPAVSTVIRLEDGRSTVIPALHGYIGHVSVDDDGVIAVSYVPVSDDWRYIEYQERASEIDRSRSMVALSIDDNRLVVRDDGEQPDRLA
ncbi:MAG: caspase family protein, partial [Acidimicrobiia bacterium]|nr:caspase family protein [Acidimicrobiia bacterium]